MGREANGYVNKIPRYEWPDGARIAVVMQIPFELSDVTAGETVEGRSSIVPALPKDVRDAGVRDLLVESFESYGALVGMWRIIDLLDRHGVTGTGVFSGVAVERYPDIARAFATGEIKREICLHSWGQDVRSYRMSREELRKTVRRCVEVVEKTTGVRPVGWVSPGASFLDETIEVLAEEGFLYQGDYAHSDSGDVVDVKGTKLVRMSVPWDVNDFLWYALHNQPPSALVEAFERSFDVLYREGGQILPVAIHASMFGRPLGVWALEQCILYAKSHADVWFATRRAIAECIKEQSSEALPYLG